MLRQEDLSRLSRTFLPFPENLVLGKGLSSITLKGLIALIALFAHRFFFGAGR